MKFFVHFFLLLILSNFTSEAMAKKPSTLDLLESVKALKNKSQELSPELKTVRAYKSQKGFESYTKFSSFLPQANLVFTKQKDFFEEKNTQLRALGVTPLDSSWGIDYTWSLINYATLQSARKSFTEEDKAELEVLIKEKEYPISFNRNVLNYLLAKYKKEAVENSLKKADAGKREAEIGFKIGQKTKIDVLRSEANMISLESRKTSFSDEEQSTRSKLIESSGLSNQDLTIFDDLSEEEILSLIKAISKSENSTIVPDLKVSPEYKRLEQEEKINSLSLASYTATQYPDLKLVGNYNNSANTFTESFHNPSRTHTVALVLTVPIFGGGNFTSSHFESYFAKKQIEYTMGQKKLQLENKLNNTLIKVNALEKLVNSLTFNVSQYEELYRLTLKSYQLGRSSIIELLEVQDNLLDAKINLAEQRIELYTLSQNYLWQAGL